MQKSDWTRSQLLRSKKLLSSQAIALVLGVSATLFSHAETSVNLPSVTIGIPSCYKSQASGPNDRPIKNPGNQRALFVLVDETTVVPTAIQKSANEALKALLAPDSATRIAPGTHVTIMRFSAFSSDHHASVMFRGDYEATPPKLIPLDQSKYTVKDFKEETQRLVNSHNSLVNCLEKQSQFVSKTSSQAIDAVMSNANSNIAQSEILVALQQVGNLIKARPEKDKVLFIISDMIEHSSFTSFYQNADMRLIDPKLEIQKLDKFGLTTDFFKANIFVIGSGLFPPTANNNKNSDGKIQNFRNPKVLQSHKQFWTLYFEKFNGNLREFGQPDLLGLVSWGN